MRLRQLQENKVAACLPPSVGDYGISDGDLAAIIFPGQHGPIPSEIEEFSRPGQPCQLLSPGAFFKKRKRQTGGPARIHPVWDDGQGMGLIKLRDWLNKFESTYSHRIIL